MGARMMMGMRDRPPGSGEVDPLYIVYSRIPIVELWIMPPGSTTVDHGLAEAAGDVRRTAPRSTRPRPGAAAARALGAGSPLAEAVAATARRLRFDVAKR